MTGLDEARKLDPERYWEGVIAHLEEPTVDNRVLDELHWAMPLPVTATVSGDFPSVVGMIRTVEIRGTDVWATGVVNDDRVAAGLHTGGIEVTEVDMTPVEGRQHMTARLRTFRLYTGTSLRPAWADVSIEVRS